MARNVLCPRCGCSHHATGAGPCKYTNVCIRCLPATPCGPLQIEPRGPQLAPTKPKKRKAGKR